jgi:hypothetical protein
LGQPGWSAAFHARGRVRGVKGRLQRLLLPVPFAVAVWLLADSVLAAIGAFLGSLFGFMVRRRVLTARHAKMGAPTLVLKWTVFQGYRETAGHFVLLSRDPNIMYLGVLPKRGVHEAEGLNRLRAILDQHTTRV